MTTSRIPVVIDALVSTLTTSLAGAATVYDGQWVTPPAGNESYVAVGWAPDLPGPTGDQEWASLGNRARTERIDVPCYADAYTGDTDTSSRRTAAFDLFAAVENALRADPTIGGVIPNPGWAQIGTYSVRQEQTENGLEVGVEFHVLIETRI